jgi:hypothetical protein
VIVDINFTGVYTPPAVGVVNLNFGSSVVGSVDPSQIAVQALLPAPYMTVSVEYDSAVSRPLQRLTINSWEQGSEISYSCSQPWGITNKLRIIDNLGWLVGLSTNSSTADAHQQSAVLRSTITCPHQQAVRAGNRTSDNWLSLLRSLRAPNVVWSVADQVSDLSESGFRQLSNLKLSRTFIWSEATRAQLLYKFIFGKAASEPATRRVPWEVTANVLNGGGFTLPVKPPYTPFSNLNFLCKCLFPDALSVRLNFGLLACEELSGLVPIQKVYFVVNTISLTLVSGGSPVGIYSASVGIDSSSWCWSFSASIPYSDLEKVEPTVAGPVEVELTINGLQWRFLVEEYDQNKVFGKTDVNIRGRSVTAFLDNPYAPVRSLSQDNLISSRQLAENELSRPGLETGFSLDWTLVDALGWVMPANTWSYTDLTPVQVFQAIAQGSGGFVNSHPKLRQLQVRPEYPAPYWEWASYAVDKVLPKSVIKSQSLRWSEKPNYNGVYVSGENTGVLALVKRAGTAGDYQAPMFVNPMISAASAARSKGLSILSSGGRQANVGLQLIMEPTIGLLTPGMIIEVNNAGVGSEAAWRGLVKSTSIAANWSNGLSVTQSINVERHYGGL